MPTEEAEGEFIAEGASGESEAPETEDSVSAPRLYGARIIMLWSAASLLVRAAAAALIGLPLTPTMPPVTVATVTTRDSSLAVFSEPPPTDQPQAESFIPSQDPRVPMTYTILQQRLIGTDGDRSVFGGLGVTNVGSREEPVWESSVCLAVEDPSGVRYGSCGSLETFQDRGIEMTTGSDGDAGETNYQWGPTGGLVITANHVAP